MFFKKLKSEVWDNVWKGNTKFPIYDKDYEENLSEYENVFKQTFQDLNGRKIIEIWCAPWGNLYWFYKKFGFDIYWIEYSNVWMDLTQKNFESLWIKDKFWNIFKEDLTKMSPEFLSNYKNIFDVVFSAWFMEHFENLDYIFEIQRDLVTPDWLVIATIPQFSFPYLFLSLFLAPRWTFFLHNWRICNYYSYKKILERHFDIIEYRWANVSLYESYMVKQYKIIYLFFQFLRKIKFIDNYISKNKDFFSPWLFFIWKFKDIWN